MKKLFDYKQIGIATWLIYLVILCFFLTLILFLLKSQSNSLFFTISIIKGNQIIGGDSWNPIINALTHFKNNPDQSIYGDIFFKMGQKFQYPLSSLLIFDLPERLFGIPYNKTVSSLNTFSFLSLFIMGFINAKILITVLNLHQFEEYNLVYKSKPIVIYFTSFLLTFLFYPLFKSYVLGQIQTILTLLTALSILSWLKGNKYVSGLLFGLVCLVKPQIALVLFWALVRKEWKLAISWILIVAVFLGVSVYFYGFYNNLEYLKVLSHLSHHGEAFYANQSVNGLMNRLLFNGSNLDWDGKFPPYSSTVYYVTLLSSIVIMLTGILWNYRKKPTSILELCIIIITTTIASPIAWEHHYGIFLTILIAVLPFIVQYENYRFIILYFLAYIFISQYLGFFKVFANSYLNLLQSYLFFGALTIFAMLLYISHKGRNNNL